MKNFLEWMLMSQLPKEGIFIRRRVRKLLYVIPMEVIPVGYVLSTINLYIYNSKCTIPNECILGKDLYYKEVTD